MLDTTSPEDLFELVREDVAAAASVELVRAPPSQAWRLVATRRSPGGDVLLVAGTDASNDHAIALLPTEAQGGGVAVGIRRAALHLGENDYLGRRRFRRDRLVPADLGVLAVAFLAEPGATAVRYERDGVEHEATVPSEAEGRCVIVDWTDPGPIDGFTGVVRGARVLPPVLPAFPYSAGFAAESFDAYWQAFAARAPDAERHAWISDAFYDLEGADFEELTIALLKALDADRHVKGLAQLGAGPIYGNGHWFYDRLEREPDIPPENVAIAMSMERPEFLPRDVRARYEALMARLATGVGPAATRH